MKRRDFLISSAATGVAMATASLAPAFARARKGNKLRFAMIGTGLRGQSQLGPLLSRDDVELVAVCDTQQVMLDQALKQIAETGRRKPRVYGGNGDVNAWKRLIDDGGVDAVMIVTPWEFHAPMAIAAMEAKIPVACEVVAGITLQDHWDVLRTQHSVDHDGDLYPSHGIGPCAMYANIHRGNRFTHINAFSTKARGLHDYILKHPKGGPDHPNAKVKFKLGDVVTTTLRCENGETILLQHDTSLPRPYSLGFRVQGTDGLWMDLNKSIHIEGRSPPHQWEDAQKYYDEYDHPLWRKYAAQAAGAGHGGMDWFVVHAFVEALKAGDPMPIDIYDAVAWSAITPLSEQSIVDGNCALDFPDFTAGQWQARKRIFALDDRY